MMDVARPETMNSPISPPSFPMKLVENIRASCDNCSKSKVRCSKDQPQCQRCAYQGVKCIYSPSQRSRKRPMGTVDSRPQRQNTTAASQEHSSPRAAPPRDNGMIDGPSVPMDDYGLGKMQTESDWNDIWTSGLFEADADNPLTWTDLTASLDEPPLHQETSTIPDLPPITSLQSPPYLEPQHSESNTGSCPWPGTVRTPLDHQCSSLIISTIQKLDVPICPKSATPGSTASLPTVGGGMGSRSLDTILKDNHTALDNVLTILRCPCTAKTNLVLLITTVCSWVLSWYEASLGRHSSGKWCSNGSDWVDGNGTWAPSRESSTTAPLQEKPSLSSFLNRVSIPSIQIGAYKIQSEQSDRIVAQLILAELVKAREVVDVFNRTYCHSNDDLSNYASHPVASEGSEDKMHFALAAFLRNRLKMVVLSARERLNYR